MPLHIKVTPHSGWQALISLLHHLKWTGHEGQPESVDAGDVWLLLHARPEYAVAHALDQGQVVHQALEQWQEEAAALLAFYKAHRARAAMVDVQATVEHTAELMEWLGRHHSAFYDIVTPFMGDVQPLDRPSEYNLLIATQIVAQTPSVGKLLVQLEASSIPLADHYYVAPRIDIDQVVQQVGQAIDGPKEQQASLHEQLDEHRKRLTETQSLSAETETALKNENELLLTQLHKVQEELETYYHKHQDGSETNGQLSSTVQELEADVSRLRTELTSARDTRNQLQENITELESDVARRQKMLTQEQEAKRQAEQEKHKAEQAKRQAEQAKREAEEAKRQAENERDALSEENDLILKQLFQVQEELEKYYLANKEQERARAKLLQTEEELEQAVIRTKKLASEQNQLKGKVEYLNGQIDSKNRKLRRFSDEKKQLKARLKLAQDALNHTQAGRGSYLTTMVAKPLRKLRRTHRMVERQVQLIENSELFDRVWYAEQNPDAVASFKNLAEHYVRHGWQEARDPGPKFSTRRYLENNPDVAESGLNPLVHYLLHGQAEGRKV